MKHRFFGILTTILMFATIHLFAQGNITPKPQQEFWKHVQFGGTIGLNFGSDFTSITIAPSAIYNFKKPVAIGAGLLYSHLNEKNSYTSNVYGINMIGLYNPVPPLQLSLEIEEISVNNTYQQINGTYHDNFWSTGLFLGAGYCSQNVTFGFRYNLLFNQNKDIYGDALMPFVRAYF